MADPNPPRLAIGTLIAIGAARLLLHFAAITQYGYFRDELYYLASTEHLDWGYVEHPPLSIAVLAVVRALLGDSLVALRIVPALAGVAAVILTGVLARALGGGRFAQGLAALAAALSPVFLGTNHYYSMNSLDLLLWTVAAWLVVRALGDGGSRNWLWLGVVMGLGLLNKISILWLGGALFVGLLLTSHRRVLAGPWPWAAAAIAGVMFVPHVVWQVRHGWPTLEFMRNATAHKMVAVAPVSFVLEQVMSMSPGSAPVWIAGLIFGLAGRAGSRGRLLAWIYVAVFGLLLAGGRSRASYLAVAYPMLLALGGAALERAGARPGLGWLRPATVALVIATGIIALPMALPLLPVATFVRYQKAVGLAPHTDGRQEMGALPQQYADMFGWDQMTDLVAEAYRRLTPEERTRARVFGQNYGEAGAIDVLGRRRGLPRAMSGHNSYGLWGPGDFDGSVLIIIGGDRADNAEFFEEIEIVGQTDSPWSMPYERGLDVSIARKPRVSLREAWPRLRFYI